MFGKISLFWFYLGNARRNIALYELQDIKKKTATINIKNILILWCLKINKYVDFFLRLNKIIHLGIKQILIILNLNRLNGRMNNKIENIYVVD